MRTLVIGAAFLFSFAAQANPHVTAAKDAVMTKKTGKGFENINLKTGMEVLSDAFISVANEKGAFVDLEFPDGHHIRLKDGGRFRLETEEDKLTSILKLGYGKLYAFYSKKNPEHLRIGSKSAVAGVRGTKFMMEETKTGAYFCVCEGSVWVKRKQKDADERIVNTGQDLWVYDGKPIDPVKDSPAMVKMTADEFKAMGFPVKP